MENNKVVVFVLALMAFIKNVPVPVLIKLFELELWGFTELVNKTY